MQPRKKNKYPKYVVATILFDADQTTDVAAAKKHGVSRQSIMDWRKLLDVDYTLRSFYNQCTKSYHEAWLNDASKFIQDTIQKLSELVQQAETIEHTRYLTEALRAVGDLKFQYLAITPTDEPQVPQTQENEGDCLEGTEAT